jgi:outer membrane protein OmpA-like peptidoglycan-associated protein
VTLLALILSQCGGDDGATGTDTDASVATTAAAAADAESEASAGEDDEATATTAEEGTTSEVTETTAEDAGTTEATVATGAGDELNALVQAALQAADLGTGVTATVADGVVTLTGSIETEEARGAAEEAVAAVAGVSSVDNQVLVEAPAAAAGSTLNETLGLAPITFDYLSARITPTGQTVLAEVVSYLQANTGNLEIQGHTDSDGSDEKNLTLSQARADSVKAFLEANGIEAARLTSVGLGETSPAVPNDSLDNKALNRRIELVLE